MRKKLRSLRAKTIYFHILEASRLAEEEVEVLARNILRKHPNLKEFVMGMGIASFNDQNGWSVDINEFAYMKPLSRFIELYDDTLKITGQCMRFTANGPKRIEW